MVIRSPSRIKRRLRMSLSVLRGLVGLRFTQSVCSNLLLYWLSTDLLCCCVIATGVTFIAMLLSFSQHVTVTLMSSLTAFFAAFLTLIAFAVDIALYAYLKHQVNKLPDVHGKTTTSAGQSALQIRKFAYTKMLHMIGFWMTFVSFILLLLAGCTVCFGRRKDRMSGATSYPVSSNPKKNFFSRFRKN